MSLNGWERRGGKRCRVGVRFAFSERFGIGGGLGPRCDLRGKFGDWFFYRVTSGFLARTNFFIP